MALDKNARKEPEVSTAVTTESDVQLEKNPAHAGHSRLPATSLMGARGYREPVLGEGAVQWPDPVRNCVADKLAQAIQFGILQAGDLLPGERELAEAFGVSRQTIRAALGRLQSRLMLAVCHGRRSRVLGPGTLDVVDRARALGHLVDHALNHVQQVRAAVDSEIVRCAAVDIDARTLQRLERLTELQQRMVNDPACFHLLDMEFHFTIYRTCANPLMVDMALDLYAQGVDYRRRALTREGAIAASVDQHRRIVAALAARDPEAAVAAMQHHMETIASRTRDEMTRQVCAGADADASGAPVAQHNRVSAALHRASERPPEIHDIMRGWTRV